MSMSSDKTPHPLKFVAQGGEHLYLQELGAARSPECRLGPLGAVRPRGEVGCVGVQAA